MTDDRTLERAARSWLEEGPTRAPDRAVEAALSRIQTIRQERDLRVPWRFPTMLNNRAAIAALAIVLIVAGGGFALSRLTAPGPGGPGPTPTASPTAAPTQTPAATAEATITQADVGVAFPAGMRRVVGFAVSLTLDLPAGWTPQEFTRNNFVLRSGNDFLTFVVMDAVYPDPCHTEGGATPVRPGVDELIAALGAMTGFELSDVADASIGGAAGKDFTLTNGIDLAAEGCTNPDVLLIGTYDRNGSGVDVLLGAGGPEALHAVDVDGTTVLIGAPQGILDGVSFEAAP